MTEPVAGAVGDLPAPPGHLTADSCRLWREVAAEYEFERSELAILAEALTARDRAAQARRLLKREGLTLLDRFGQRKPHPAAQVEASAADRFARMMKQLGLAPVESDDDAKSAADDRRSRVGRHAAYLRSVS